MLTTVPRRATFEPAERTRARTTLPNYALISMSYNRKFSSAGSNRERKRFLVISDLDY